MRNTQWWIRINRLFFVIEVYVIFVPALLVALSHYLSRPAPPLTLRTVFFNVRVLIFTVALAAIFFALSIVDETFSPVVRPFVALAAEPVLELVFPLWQRDGFWFVFVRGLFATLASVLAMAPVIYFFARFAFTLPGYLLPKRLSAANSWSLTSGAVGAKLAAMLALTPFVKFVLLQFINVGRGLYLPIQNPIVLEAFLVTDDVLVKLTTVAQMLLIGALIAIAYRQVSSIPAETQRRDG